jgi:hypothetical protein
VRRWCGAKKNNPAQMPSTNNDITMGFIVFIVSTC